jgi:hypothetical protein
MIESGINGYKPMKSMKAEKIHYAHLVYPSLEVEAIKRNKVKKIARGLIEMHIFSWSSLCQFFSDLIC